MSEFSLMAIALGGAFGSVSRFLVAQEMGRRFGDFLPYGTFAVNVIGSLALGWLATIFLIVRKSTAPSVLALLLDF